MWISAIRRFVKRKSASWPGEGGTFERVRKRWRRRRGEGVSTVQWFWPTRPSSRRYEPFNGWRYTCFRHDESEGGALQFGRTRMLVFE
jgi:hypothetical protein